MTKDLGLQSLFQRTFLFASDDNSGVPRTYSNPDAQRTIVFEET